MSCNLRLDIKYGQVENSDSEWDMNSRSLGKPSTNRYRETNESTYYDTSPAYTNKRRNDKTPYIPRPPSFTPSTQLLHTPI